MTPRRSWAMLVATALALAACGGGEDDASPTSPPTTTITDSQRRVLLAEAACAVVLPEDVETAFGRTVVSGGNEVGACRFILEPGLAGPNMIVQATIWIAQPGQEPRQFFEERRVKDRIVEVSGVGFPTVYDPLTSDVWALVEPSNATLPGRASDLGSVEVAVLDLQVLLPGVGVAPDEVQDEILAGLRSLIAVVAPRL